MKYQIEWSRHAIRNVRRLAKSVLGRINTAIETFAYTGHGDVKRLQGFESIYRLRVGDWRVRFSLEDDEIHIMLIQAVLPLGEAYKDL